MKKENRMDRRLGRPRSVANDNITGTFNVLRHENCLRDLSHCHSLWQYTDTVGTNIRDCSTVYYEFLRHALSASLCDNDTLLSMTSTSGVLVVFVRRFIKAFGKVWEDYCRIYLWYFPMKRTGFIVAQKCNSYGISVGWVAWGGSRWDYLEEDGLFI